MLVSSTDMTKKGEETDVSHLPSSRSAECCARPSPDALLISSQEMEEDPASLPPPEFPEFSPAAADEDPDEEKQDDGVGVCGRAPLLLRQEVGTNTMHRSTAPFQPLVDHTESNSVSERPSPARPDSLSVCEAHDGTHNPTAVASTLPSSPSTGAVPEATNSPVVLMSGGSIPCASFATLAPSSANAAAPRQLKEGTPVVVRRVPRSPVAVVPLVDSTDGASVRTCPPPPPPPMPLPSILSSSSSFSKMSQASTSAGGGTAQQQQHQHPHNTFVSSMSMRRSQCIVQLKGWEVLEADDAALTHNQQLRQAQLPSSSSLSSGAPAGSGGQPSQQHNAAPGMVTCSSVTVFVRTTGKEESVLPCTATLVGSPSTPPQEQKEQLARGEATSSTIGVLNSTVSSVASAASCSSSSLALLHNPTVKCEPSVIVGSQQSPTLRRRKPPPPKLMSARQWESFTAVHAGVRASSPTSSGTVSSPRKVHHQTQNTSTTTKSTSDETSEQTSFPQGSPTWPTVPPAPPPPPPPVPSSASKPPPRLLTFTPSAEGGGPNPNSSSTCSYHHHHHPSSPAVKSPPLSCPTSATAGGGEGMGSSSAFSPRRPTPLSNTNSSGSPHRTSFARISFSSSLTSARSPLSPFESGSPPSQLVTSSSMGSSEATGEEREADEEQPQQPRCAEERNAKCGLLEMFAETSYATSSSNHNTAQTEDELPEEPVPEGACLMPRERNVVTLDCSPTLTVTVAHSPSPPRGSNGPLHQQSIPRYGSSSASSVLSGAARRGGGEGELSNGGGQGGSISITGRDQRLHSAFAVNETSSSLCSTGDNHSSPLRHHHHHLQQLQQGLPLVASSSLPSYLFGSSAPTFSTTTMEGVFLAPPRPPHPLDATNNNNHTTTTGPQYSSSWSSAPTAMALFPKFPLLHRPSTNLGTSVNHPQQPIHVQQQPQHQKEPSMHPSPRTDLCTVSFRGSGGGTQPHFLKWPAATASSTSSSSSVTLAGAPPAVWLFNSVDAPLPPPPPPPATTPLMQDAFDDAEDVVVGAAEQQQQPRHPDRLQYRVTAQQQETEKQEGRYAIPHGTTEDNDTDVVPTNNNDTGLLLLLPPGHPTPTPSPVVVLQSVDEDTKDGTRDDADDKASRDHSTKREASLLPPPQYSERRYPSSSSTTTSNSNSSGWTMVSDGERLTVHDEEVGGGERVTAQPGAANLTAAAVILEGVPTSVVGAGESHFTTPYEPLDYPNLFLGGGGAGSRGRSMTTTPPVGWRMSNGNRAHTTMMGSSLVSLESGHQPPHMTTASGGMASPTFSWYDQQQLFLRHGSAVGGRAGGGGRMSRHSSAGSLISGGPPAVSLMVKRNSQESTTNTTTTTLSSSSAQRAGSLQSGGSSSSTPLRRAHSGPAHRTGNPYHPQWKEGEQPPIVGQGGVRTVDDSLASLVSPSPTPPLRSTALLSQQAGGGVARRPPPLLPQEEWAALTERVGQPMHERSAQTTSSRRAPPHHLLQYPPSGMHHLHTSGGGSIGRANRRWPSQHLHPQQQHSQQQHEWNLGVSSSSISTSQSFHWLLPSSSSTPSSSSHHHHHHHHHQRSSSSSGGGSAVLPEGTTTTTTTSGLLSASVGGQQQQQQADAARRNPTYHHEDDVRESQRPSLPPTAQEPPNENRKTSMAKDEPRRASSATHVSRVDSEYPLPVAPTTTTSELFRLRAAQPMSTLPSGYTSLPSGSLSHTFHSSSGVAGGGGGGVASALHAPTNSSGTSTLILFPCRRRSHTATTVSETDPIPIEPEQEGGGGGTTTHALKESVLPPPESTSRIEITSTSRRKSIIHDNQDETANATIAAAEAHQILAAPPLSDEVEKAIAMLRHHCCVESPNIPTAPVAGHGGRPATTYQHHQQNHPHRLQDCSLTVTRALSSSASNSGHSHPTLNPRHHVRNALRTDTTALGTSTTGGGSLHLSDVSMLISATTTTPLVPSPPTRPNTTTSSSSTTVSPTTLRPLYETAFAALSSSGSSATAIAGGGESGASTPTTTTSSRRPHPKQNSSVLEQKPTPVFEPLQPQKSSSSDARPPRAPSHASQCEW